MRRSPLVECTFPRAEQLLDVPPLGVAELEPLDEPPGFRRVVVLDRRLEALAQRRRLRELAPQPAEEAYLRRFHASNCRPSDPFGRRGGR